MITDVGIDLDGVMYDFATVFRSYAQDRMGKELSAPTKWDFYKEWGMTDEQFNQWLEEGVKNLRLFNYLRPMHNTLEGWQLLRDNKLNIHVLTHRHPHSYEQTVQWLMKYDLIPNSLHFGTNKTILKTLALDECAAIDDMPQYYDSYNNIGVLSFFRTQPWNDTRKGRRVSDLLEFAEAILAINKAKEVLRDFATSPIIRPNIWTSSKFPTDQLQASINTNPHVNSGTIINYTETMGFRRKHEW